MRRADRILEALTPWARSRIEALTCLDAVTSTNRYLADAEPSVGRSHAVIAREQTDGRGRAGHRWHSPKDGGLWLSIAHTFEERNSPTGSLALALGVAVADALEAIGVSEVALKWPNDIVAGGGKLGGMLIESRGRRAIFGVGINTAPVDPAAVGERPLLPPTDLEALLGEAPAISRLAAAVLERVAEALERYARDGFAPFVAEWNRRDWLKGRDVAIADLEPPVSGRATGIADDGALLVSSDAATVRVVAGTVLLASDSG